MTKKELLAENNSLKEEIKDLKEEGRAIGKSMGDMYNIITNDKGMTSISLDQPLEDIVNFNIAIMLKKFEMMSAVIEDGLDDKTLIDRIEEIKSDHNALLIVYGKVVDDLKDHRKHFNMMIDLIKDCDTDEKLQALKELDQLDEE